MELMLISLVPLILKIHSTASYFKECTIIYQYTYKHLLFTLYSVLCEECRPWIMHMKIWAWKRRGKSGKMKEQIKNRYRNQCTGITATADLLELKSSYWAVEWLKLQKWGLQYWLEFVENGSIQVKARNGIPAVPRKLRKFRARSKFLNR